MLARVLKAGALYFGVVFGAGFVLGPIRVIWVVPRLGERTAELIEAPLMLAVTIVAARWVVRRLAVPAVVAQRLGIGLIRLGLLLVAELVVVLLVRGLTVNEYIASRDAVSGTVYLALLAVFAVMPLLVVGDNLTEATGSSDGFLKDITADSFPAARELWLLDAVRLDPLSGAA